MEFQELLSELNPQLTAIARKTQRASGPIGVEDLVQEMHVHLWTEWVRGALQDKTKSYILQSCWFHIKNFWRTEGDKLNALSIHKPLDADNEILLGDTIPDRSISLLEETRWRIYIHKISNNGLTPREKEVFALSMDGYTLREIGSKLNVSFVMIHKIRQSIISKWSHKIDFDN